MAQDAVCSPVASHRASNTRSVRRQLPPERHCTGQLHSLTVVADGICCGTILILSWQCHNQKDSLS